MDLEPEVFELAGDEDTHNIPDLLEEIAVLNKRLEVAEVQNVSNKVLRSENEKTIRRLVAELQQQRNQTPAPKHDPDGEDLNRKIATMDCEYRKLECNVKRYEVACEKLLQFCQLAHENLSEAQGTELFVNYPRGTGESARGGNDVLGNPRPPAALANHTKFTNITLAQEAQETVAAVRKIISQASVLPRGWDEAYTEDGLKYYINYETQTTTWLHPVTKTGHTKFSRHGEMTAPFTQPPNL
eukprot:TRINITY_DN1247_c0_g1_i2.p1 TRINITY_DN1247_c0_g1~~TRINITY_DN1247_c0_g1_i2.p1  ORF type:complete len:242 (+),score=48.11 TRINITY_DN1247_c0_g1_i2:180-905(+)